jgi:hypothetical protein
MSTLAFDIEETLQDLDPESATRFERLVRDAIAVVKPLRKTASNRLDSNGWPVGYFEQTFGCVKGETWDLPTDPPPEPTEEP